MKAFFHKTIAIVVSTLTIWFINSCQKEPNGSSTPECILQTIAEDVNTKVTGTDYSVTKEMIESYIKSNSKHKDIISIEEYPSEESPSMFVVNFDEGWVIYPADSRFGMSLAESPSDHLNINDETHNLGFQLVIEDYHNQICHFDEYSYQMIDSVALNILNRKPVIITAAKSSNTDSRHTWIIDGVSVYRTFFQKDFEIWPVSMVPEGATIVQLMTEDQLSAVSPDYYPGMGFHQEIGYTDSKKFKMNFGAEGQYKWDQYVVLPSSSWEGYEIIKSVHYNLSPNDLFIQ